MNDIAIKPNTLLKGALFPELVKVIAVVHMGDSMKLICEGLTTDKVHQPILTPDQVKLLEILPSDDRPFDGDAAKFRLGIEALRLGLAYEYGETCSCARFGRNHH